MKKFLVLILLSISGALFADSMTLTNNTNHPVYFFMRTYDKRPEKHSVFCVSPGETVFTDAVRYYGMQVYIKDKMTFHSYSYRTSRQDSRVEVVPCKGSCANSLFQVKNTTITPDRTDAQTCGITKKYIQEKQSNNTKTSIFSKRAWACRNHQYGNEDYLALIGGHFNLKEQDERLKKNNCTPEEIKAGEKLQLAVDLGVKLPVGLAAMVAATVGPIIAIENREAKKITNTYGANWRNRCAEIVKDPSMPSFYQNQCRHILQIKEQKQIKDMKTTKRHLERGNIPWSGTSPLHKK